jgi:thymidylate synthase (FAD)
MEIEIIKPSHKIETGIDGRAILKRLEMYGRLSHKSEDKIKDNSAEDFIKKILGWGHESILEHESLTVRFICDRGVTHELVRHRLAAYTQESTRYCDYSGKIQFIEPIFFEKDSEKYNSWLKGVKEAAENYNDLRQKGALPEEARSLLPNSLKTEIVMTANLREWRHVFLMRTAPAAHPQIREIMIPLLLELQKLIPVIFADFVINSSNNTARQA